MCGIAGFITPQPLSDQTIGAVDAAIAHRGPDDAGVWRGEHAGRHVTLVHRRLSILDLDHGHQPMLGAGGRHVIVYNGEIYNSPQLRERLKADGHAFETTCDTEVLLRLYEAKGEAMVDDLRGMFAFAIWDTHTGELFLARDHHGQKPLFYLHDPDAGVFAFASEIKGLLASGLVRAEIDPETLWHHAGLRFCPGERTLIKGVCKLDTATRAVYSPATGALRTERYWQQDWSQKTEMTFDEALDRLDSVLSDSVHAHLLSDVPTGSFLSGGLDSSTIAALATRHAGKGWPTFSIGVGDGDFSELPAARLASDTIGSDHHELKINPDLFLMLPDVLWHLEEPADQPAVGMYLLSQFARRTVKVALGGEGGDEHFGGYTRYTQSPVLKAYQRIPRLLRTALYAPAVRLLPESYSYYSLAMQARWLHEITLRQGADRHTHILTFWRFPHEERTALFTGDALRRIDDPDTSRFVARWHDAGLADTEPDRYMLTEMSLRMANSDLRTADRVSMAHALELRSPIVDREVTAFAAALPTTYKIRGKKLKILLRELNRRMFPPEFTDRPKYGFSFPMARWFQTDLADFARTTLLDGGLVGSGLFNRDTVADILDTHRAGKRDLGLQIWYLINLEIWRRLFILGEDREQLRADIAGQLENSGAHSGGNHAAA
ncbi:MAG: asparagine synthase (glutamine-hydrolyzing) [Phycisphaerales bacterium JB040]